MDKTLRPSIFKRLLALIVDFIILGIVGFISGLFFEDFYVSLGRYGTLIGSTLTIIYFSILQSKIGHGQTLGKKAIGAKVISTNGKYLDISKSFLRAFIIFFPIMNMEIFSGGNGMLVVVVILLLIIFSSVYLVFVNKSRRSLHDILVSSIVVNENVSDIELDELNDKSTRKLIPIGGMAVLLIGIGLYQLFSENTLSQLLNAKHLIEQQDGVISVNEIKSSTTTQSSTNEPTITYTSVKTTIRIDDKSKIEVNSRYFDEFFNIIQAEVPAAQNVDKVIITLYYGYNIGIASKTKSVTKTFE